MVENFEELFSDINFEQIPCINNREAYTMEIIRSLLNMSNNILQCEFFVEQLLIWTFEIPKFEFVCVIFNPRSPWYHDIFTDLRKGTLPSDITSNLKKTFFKKESWFMILGDTLYHRSIEGTLIWCLNQEEALTTLTEVHNGICGSHFSGMTLAKNLLRMGYYWPTMDREAHQYRDLIHAPTQELLPMITPWPFLHWGLDLIGNITLTSTNGHNFIITATKYFTKWVEAIHMTYIMGNQITKFILNLLVCYYGIPQSLIFDNGTPFKNQDVKELCQNFNIQHWFSTPYYPQGNDQFEATNKTSLKILNKMVNEASRE